MGFIDTVKKLLIRTAPPVNTVLPQADDPDPEEIRVPEWQVGQALAALQSDAPPLLLDVREPYEWRQVRMPNALHIPMNDVPQHLEALPRERTIVVLCAHGSRSFGVTYFLRQQGFDAYNLVGGITQWHIQGGEVETRTTL